MLPTRLIQSCHLYFGTLKATMHKMLQSLMVSLMDKDLSVI